MLEDTNLLDGAQFQVVLVFNAMTAFQNYNDYSIQMNQTNTPDFLIIGLLYVWNI